MVGTAVPCSVSHYYYFVLHGVATEEVLVNISNIIIETTTNETNIIYKFLRSIFTWQLRDTGFFL